MRLDYDGVPLLRIPGIVLNLAQLMLRFSEGWSCFSAFKDYRVHAISQRERKMRRLTNISKRLLKDEEGAVLVEYALLVALIALAVVAALELTGTSINTLFSKIASSLSNASVPSI